MLVREEVRTPTAVIAPRAIRSARETPAFCTVRKSCQKRDQSTREPPRTDLEEAELGERCGHEGTCVLGAEAFTKSVQIRLVRTTARAEELTIPSQKQSNHPVLQSRKQHRANQRHGTPAKVTEEHASVERQWTAGRGGEVAPFATTLQQCSLSCLPLRKARRDQRTESPT